MMAENAKGRLPDFIFGRNKSVENAGFRLAGKLVTNVPTWAERTKTDVEMVEAIIRSLVNATRDNPDIQEAGFWRGAVPWDALDPPFPVAQVLERMRRCVVLEVRVRKDADIDDENAVTVQWMGRKHMQ